MASVYRSAPAATINPPQAEPPRLLDRLRFALRAKHYAYRTEQAYVHWVRRFIVHHGIRHPQEMGGPEIEAFLTHLAVAGRVSAGTQIACSGLTVRMTLFLRLMTRLHERVGMQPVRRFASDHREVRRRVYIRMVHPRSACRGLRRRLLP